MGERLDSVVAAAAGVTRSQARSLIMEGRVRIDGNPATKPGAAVPRGARVDVVRPPRFVSRGGEKLEHALRAFHINAAAKNALDVGASTGGFTDCLLQNGAAHVVALDVGYGQLDWRLRNDSRVTVIERTNFRYLADDAFAQPFDLIVIDASFISVRTIVARAVGFLAPDGDIVALVKPQFEAGRERLGRGGVVRDPDVHRAILLEVRDAMPVLGMTAVDVTPSPLKGPAGNREFLMRLRRHGEPVADEVIDRVICEGSST
ncbi:MAG TPA: TlyA family RNA methyltransferase [Candidatus Baltobacteraceae bacterium]|jgi:23S rRNA (cytidine1920-2'-O)/16S rRNA (cytidine1409-2'-O)-methyltransferase|nr:TlyA family RNA methyltransferase [Candidatus Baltobacteraceae bacterium]